MKIAIIYNRESQRVINLFGIPNREKYGLETIRRITEALASSGHIVQAMEGDKDIIDKLEDFMPRVLKGQRPGMVLNLSYGIQGQARYTHIPSILEMVGIPYVGSGPLAHSLALDKVVSKMIFVQHGLPTPKWAVLSSPKSSVEGLNYPLIVKPKNEAVSFGLELVHDEAHLRKAARNIFDQFGQDVLVEEFIEGREINVAILGNSPAEALEPVELLFETGPTIFTLEDKKLTSGRTVGKRCPAELGEELTGRAKQLALQAFKALGCADCARIDMRLDGNGNLYILEINSLPSLGRDTSYVVAARHAGLDFGDLVNHLIETASARYFGMPVPVTPVNESSCVEERVVEYITQHRDDMKKQLEQYVNISSRTADPMGVKQLVNSFGTALGELKLKPARQLTDNRWVWTWQSRAGLENGTLLVVQADSPISEGIPHQAFRRSPENIYGENIANSRAPLAMVQYALAALAGCKQLSKLPAGVLIYADEGLACSHSARLIKDACSRAARVLIVRSPGDDDSLIVDRRGERHYDLIVEHAPLRLASAGEAADPLMWTADRLSRMTKLAQGHDRLAIAAVDLRTNSYPMKLPHRVVARVQVTYASTVSANRANKQIIAMLEDDSMTSHLELVQERPPLTKRKLNVQLAQKLAESSRELDLDLTAGSSSWPGVAGLVPHGTPVVCGLGPVSKNIYTPHESISRISFVQRTLMLARFLLAETAEKSCRKM